MTWPPHITVATLVERDNLFLMVEETEAGQQVINQPAGHLDPGETLYEAAIRETLEETGWEVKPSAIIGIYHYLHPVTDIIYHRITYAAEAVRQASTELDPDISQVLWLSAEEILGDSYVRRSPVVAECLKDYQQGQRYPLTLIKE